MRLDDVPRPLARRAVEVAGWIELGCASHALMKLEPLLANPGARPFALKLQATALVELKRWRDALEVIESLRGYSEDSAWIDLTEGWCQKRLGDLRAAATCMERLVGRDRRSAIGHFNLGCYLALLGERDRAIDEVTIACGIDPSFRQLLDDEHDLDALRGDPRFVALRPKEG